MDKNTRDIKSINARLNKLQNQLTDNILEVSFGQTDTELTVGAIVYNISLSANLEGKIPKGERFMLSFPDGSNPLIIQNEKEDLTTSVDTIPIYVDGTETWEQLIYPSVTYPIGSLISSVNYAANDTNFASGNNQEVQFNSQGELAGDSNFTFDSSTDTLSATNISGDLTGDVTGNVSGSSGSCTGNSATATKIASITNSDIVQLTDTQTLTNKTLTSPTLTTPALGTPSSGDLTNCTFPTLNQDTTGNAATATKIASITNSDIVQLTDTQTLTNKTLTDCEANTQAVGDDSTKIATTAFVQANGGGTPGGGTSDGYHSIQFNSNGSFGGDSNPYDLGYNDSTNVFSVYNTFITNDLTVGNSITAGQNLHIGNQDTTLTRISAGVVGIEGKEIVTKNKQRHVINCGFYHGTDSIVYLPFGYGGTNDSTSSSGYLEYGGYVVPCDGYVDFVVVRGENAGGNTTVGLIKAPAGQEVPIISAGSGISDTTNMAYDDTGYRFDNFTDQGGTVKNSFEAGDVIMFTLNTSSRLDDAIATAVLVFDWDNEL